MLGPPARRKASTASFPPWLSDAGSSSASSAVAVARRSLGLCLQRYARRSFSLLLLMMLLRFTLGGGSTAYATYVHACYRGVLILSYVDSTPLSSSSTLFSATAMRR